VARFKGAGQAPGKHQKENKDERERGEKVDHAVVEPSHLAIIHWTAKMYLLKCESEKVKVRK